MYQTNFATGKLWCESTDYLDASATTVCVHHVVRSQERVCWWRVASIERPLVNTSHHKVLFYLPRTPPQLHLAFGIQGGARGSKIVPIEISTPYSCSAIYVHTVDLPILNRLATVQNAAYRRSDCNRLPMQWHQRPINIIYGTKLDLTTPTTTSVLNVSMQWSLGTFFCHILRLTSWLTK